MAKYKIVNLKKQYKEMSEEYPSLIKSLYQQPNNLYTSKQTELLFERMNDIKEQLLHILYNREDYSYYHGVHQLVNPITDEQIRIIFNEYDIEIEEPMNNHAIFDMIQVFSHNFCMIEL